MLILLMIFFLTSELLAQDVNQSPTVVVQVLTAEESQKVMQTKSSSEILSLIDQFLEINQPVEAAKLYQYFECLTVDESIIRHSNKVIDKLREQGKKIIATTDPHRQPNIDELVVVYGNYQHAHNNLPYTNKIWRHPLYYQELTHSKFEYHPAWDPIGIIYIIGLEDRHDRYQEILAELCRMRAPLNRIHRYIAKRESITGDPGVDILAGATKNHADVTDHFLKVSNQQHCLILEDDVTFSADIDGNLDRLKRFFDRAYDYEVCLLNASKFHEIKPHDDLLLKSYQICTTTSAYLLSRKGAQRALFYFRDGYDKLLKHKDARFVCDRYWAEMQKNGKFFLFKTKFGYQRCNYSSITGKTECFFD